jgi:biotin synthase
VARIVLPTTMVRLSAGRESMSDELQAMCFLAGANSVFWGDKLLTTKNNGAGRDARLFEKLGLRAWDPQTDAVVGRPTSPFTVVGEALTSSSSSKSAAADAE